MSFHYATGVWDLILILENILSKQKGHFCFPFHMIFFGRDDENLTHKLTFIFGEK